MSGHQGTDISLGVFYQFTGEIDGYFVNVAGESERRFITRRYGFPEVVTATQALDTKNTGVVMEKFALPTSALFM